MKTKNSIASPRYSVTGDTGQRIEHQVGSGVDTRNFAIGRPIPAEHYCDQPKIIKTDDGAWLCALTTGSAEEGNPGQHVVTSRSTDQGETWEDLVDVEPSGGPEASYAALLKVPSGRIYCFYNHNTDKLSEVAADDPPYAGGVLKRVDSLGYFVFKYSDDHGKSWSSCRYEIRLRETEMDRENPYGGRVRFFWNTCAAFAWEGFGYVPLSKVGRFGHGLYAKSEGVLLRSDNLLSEADPEKIRWETLPEGERGLRTPAGGGEVAEEVCYVPLVGDRLFAIYRTVDGAPATSYSGDAGKTWEAPAYAAYSRGGRKIRHPRAACFVWRCENGKYLFWYHNNGTKDYNSASAAGNRNIAWITSGSLDAEGRIRWKEPEIGFYCDERLRGASYPDMIEESGEYFFTMTQKHAAAVLRLDPEIASILMREESEPTTVVRKGLILEAEGEECACGTELPAPGLPPLLGRIDHYARVETEVDRGGFSIEVVLQFESLGEGQILLDGTDESGRGIRIATAPGGAIRFSMNDGFQGAYWDCDPGLLRTGVRHHVTVIVDGGAKCISFVVDGRLNDGGGVRPFGYGRFVPIFKEPQGSGSLRVAPQMKGSVQCLRLYNRFLLTNEAVGNHRATP
jgi:hypothetical protein